jgi:hypothetical protein
MTFSACLSALPATFFVDVFDEQAIKNPPCDVASAGAFVSIGS